MNHSFPMQLRQISMKLSFGIILVEGAILHCKEDIVCCSFECFSCLLLNGQEMGTMRSSGLGISKSCVNTS